MLYSSDQPIYHILAIANSYTYIAQYVVAQVLEVFTASVAEDSSVYCIALRLWGRVVSDASKDHRTNQYTCTAIPEHEEKVIVRNVDKYPTTQRHIPGDFSLSCTITTVSSSGVNAVGCALH